MIDVTDLIERLRAGVPEVGLHEDNNTELFDIENANETMAEAADALSTIKQTDAVEAETYRQMHETAKELGYPSILEALEHLDELKQTDAVEAEQERCARIAEASDPCADFCCRQERARIAAAIRGAK